MALPSLKPSFQRQTEGFNRIPVSRTVLADAETPLSAYAKLAQGRDPFSSNP